MNSYWRCKRPGKAGAIGPAQPVFFRAMEDVDGGVPGGQIIGDLAGAIGRIVIDDEQVDGDGQFGQTVAMAGRFSRSL